MDKAQIFAEDCMVWSVDYLRGWTLIVEIESGDQQFTSRVSKIKIKIIRVVIWKQVYLMKDKILDCFRQYLCLMVGNQSVLFWVLIIYLFYKEHNSVSHSSENLQVLMFPKTVIYVRTWVSTWVDGELKGFMSYWLKGAFRSVLCSLKLFSFENVGLDGIYGNFLKHYRVL